LPSRQAKRRGNGRATTAKLWLAAPLLAAGALLAGCGGSSDAAPAAADPGLPPAANVTLAGEVTFDFVPAVVNLGLDYSNTTPRPARGVTVELVENGTVLASTVTDSAGRYSFSVAPQKTVAVRVRAEMVKSGAPGWNYRVVDNVNGDALYVLDGQPASTGSANSTRNLHAPSGWSGTSYTGARSAAPFAILDAVYDATQFVLSASPALTFPPLTLNWSPTNQPALGADGVPDPASGMLGTSFFLPAGTPLTANGAAIFLLGYENSDTEEYDRHVIVHEWGHYFEHSFSRSDSIGGPHTRGDQLDMRVAFGEGWGNALSAMVTGQSVYRDVMGPSQRLGFGFDVEGPLPNSPNPNPGWFSEESVQEIVYDLFDDSPFDAAQDGVLLGFEPLFSVLTNQQRFETALTSIFTFVNALKRLRPTEAPLIDQLVSAHDIALVIDGYGAGETNFGAPTEADIEPGDVTSVYTPMTVNGGTVNVCSLDAYSSNSTGATNKLGSRRYLRFTVNAPGTHTITAVTTVMPSGQTSDPDMVLHRAGTVARFESAPNETSCLTSNPAGCSELGNASLTLGDYVLEVYEWTNTNDADDEFPPIGRTCFDVAVTRP
jgi:hypothetical protein